MPCAGPKAGTWESYEVNSRQGGEPQKPLFFGHHPTLRVLNTAPLISGEGFSLPWGSPDLTAQQVICGKVTSPDPTTGSVGCS